MRRSQIWAVFEGEAADVGLGSSCPSRKRWELRRVPWYIESGADISQAPNLSRPHGLKFIILVYPYNYSMS